MKNTIKKWGQKIKKNNLKIRDSPKNTSCSQKIINNNDKFMQKGGKNPTK